MKSSLCIEIKHKTVVTSWSKGRHRYITVDEIRLEDLRALHDSHIDLVSRVVQLSIPWMYGCTHNLARKHHDAFMYLSIIVSLTCGTAETRSRKRREAVLDVTLTLVRKDQSLTCPALWCAHNLSNTSTSKRSIGLNPFRAHLKRQLRSKMNEQLHSKTQTKLIYWVSSPSLTPKKSPRNVT